jgi:hypothetical protein
MHDLALNPLPIEKTFQILSPFGGARGSIDPNKIRKDANQLLMGRIDIKSRQRRASRPKTMQRNDERKSQLGHPSILFRTQLERKPVRIG